MSLEASIKKTIAYAKKYDCSLTIDDIHQRLISKNQYSKKEIEKKIKNKKELILKNKNIWLPKKLQKTREIAKLIEKKFKEILFLGITGSVAAEYPKRDDDIDLMIITEKNCLWLTRLKLRWFVFAHKISHRKFGQKEKKDQFCFNLWLDEQSLKLSKNKRNLRNAVDLILIKPLINKNKTYEKFLMANDWAKKWVANGYLDRRSSIVDKTLCLDKLDISLKKGGLFASFLNFLVFVPQYLWMWPKIKGEQIDLRRAFFHRN